MQLKYLTHLKKNCEIILYCAMYVYAILNYRKIFKYTCIQLIFYI